MASRIPAGGPGININDDHDPGSEAARRGAELLQTLMRMADQWHAEQARRRDYEERRGTHPGTTLAKAGEGREADRGLRADDDRKPPPRRQGGDPAARDPADPEPAAAGARTWDGEQLRTAPDPAAAATLADRLTAARDSRTQQQQDAGAPAAEPRAERHLRAVPDPAADPDAGRDQVEQAAAEQAAAVDRAAMWAADDRDPGTVVHLGGTNPAAGDAPVKLDGLADSAAAVGAEAAQERAGQAGPDDPLARHTGDPLQAGAGDPLHGAPAVPAEDAGEDLGTGPGRPRR